MMITHRFPTRLKEVIRCLTSCWNTRIVVRTKQWYEQSGIIKFNRGLPQGDALCPRHFTFCLGPAAWLMKSTERYKLSKPIDDRVTHLLYIDDLKVFASIGSKMNTVLRLAVGAMKDLGLHVNSKKCSTVSFKRGTQVCDADDVKVDESTVLKNLKENEQYKFLGILETVKQEDNLALEQRGEYIPTTNVGDLVPSAIGLQLCHCIKPI